MEPKGCDAGNQRPKKPKRWRPSDFALILESTDERTIRLGAAG